VGGFLVRQALRQEALSRLAEGLQGGQKRRPLERISDGVQSGNERTDRLLHRTRRRRLVCCAASQGCSGGRQRGRCLSGISGSQPAADGAHRGGVGQNLLGVHRGTSPCQSVAERCQGALIV